MNEHLLEERTRLMGAALGTFCHHLEQDFDSLSVKWCESTNLFREDEGQIDLLNAVASTFFYLVSQLMFNDAMLHLSRLSDPAQQGIYENLSIRRLPELIPDDDFRLKVESEVSKAVRACEFARVWRDKRLAHNSVDIATGQKLISHPDVVRDTVSKGIAAIGDVLRLVAKHYGAYSQASTSPKPNPWGSRALVLRLRGSQMTEGH